MSQREIDACLAGDLSYDDLDEADQAVVRAEWDKRIQENIAKLDFAKEFRAKGERYSTGDEHGNLVIWEPGDVKDETKTVREDGVVVMIYPRPKPRG